MDAPPSIDRHRLLPAPARGIDCHGAPATTPEFADAAGLDTQAMTEAGDNRFRTSASAAIVAAPG